MANDPLIGQKLLIREGIEMVLQRLEDVNEQQERGISEINRGDAPNRS